MANSVKFAVRSNAIIIGTGLSGLVAGAVLARGGKKVTVLLDEKAREEKPLFSPFLQPMLSVGFERDSPVERIFSELGISLSLLRRSNDLFRKNSAWLQIIFPEFRFTIYSDRNETLSNLKAGFGERVLTFKHFLEKMDSWIPVLTPYLYDEGIPPLNKENWLRPLTDWLWYRFKVARLRVKNAAQFCQECGLDEDGIAYFNALVIFQTGQTLQNISTLELFRLLQFISHDPLVATKSLSGLSELFLKIIKENKGEVLTLTPNSLRFEKKRIAGIEFQGREGIGCDCLIWNPRNGNLQGERENKIFQLFFELDEMMIPTSMADFLILKRNPQLPLEKFNFLYLSMAEKEVSNSKEVKQSSSKRGLVVQCPVDSGGPEVNEKELAKEIEERLVWLMPFAENHLRLSGILLNQPELKYPSFFPQEAIRKAGNPRKKSCPVILLGKSFYFFPHLATPFLIHSSLIKRGYDLANIVKAGN